METERSLGVTISGWYEIIKGAIGSFLFFAYLPSIIQNIFSKGDVGGGLGELFILLTFIFVSPCPLMLWSGIGILRLDNFNRKMNIIVNLIFLFFISGWIIFLFVVAGPEYHLAQLKFELISCLITLPSVILLKNNNVKGQFHL